MIGLNCKPLLNLVLRSWDCRNVEALRLSGCPRERGLEAALKCRSAGEQGRGCEPLGPRWHARSEDGQSRRTGNANAGGPVSRRFCTSHGHPKRDKRFPGDIYLCPPILPRCLFSDFLSSKFGDALDEPRKPQPLEVQASGLENRFVRAASSPPHSAASRTRR